MMYKGSSPFGYTKYLCGAMVAQDAYIVEAVGSSPSTSTKKLAYENENFEEVAL